MIPNPAYKPTDDLYKFQSFGAAGLELWQVKAGVIFDNFLVTDDEELAAAARKNINTRRANEQALEKVESEAAAKAAAEEAAKNPAPEGGDAEAHEDL